MKKEYIRTTGTSFFFGPGPRGRTYSRARESIQIVTGPSFTSDTYMSAPKHPVATGRPSAAASAATKRS